jgi:hypothetical protein
VLYRNCSSCFLFSLAFAISCFFSPAFLYNVDINNRLLHVLYPSSRACRNASSISDATSRPMLTQRAHVTAVPSSLPLPSSFTFFVAARRTQYLDQPICLGYIARGLLWSHVFVLHGCRGCMLAFIRACLHHLNCLSQHSCVGELFLPHHHYTKLQRMHHLRTLRKANLPSPLQPH